MAESDQHGTFDSVLGKGEEALDKAMDDPEKVAKGKQKAEELLGEHMSQDQADKVTNMGEEGLRKFSDRNEQQ